MKIIIKSLIKRDKVLSGNFFLDSRKIGSFNYQNNVFIYNENEKYPLYGKSFLLEQINKSKNNFLINSSITKELDLLDFVLMSYDYKLAKKAIKQNIKKNIQ